jgi:hypothetical protein
MRILAIGLLFGNLAYAVPTSFPVPIHIDGKLVLSDLRVVLDHEVLHGTFETFATNARSRADLGLVRAIQALRAGEAQRAREVLNLSQTTVSPDEFFITLAVGYRGFPDMRMIARMETRVGTVYHFDYKGVETGSRTVRGLIVDQQGRARPVTDVDSAFGLVQWGYRGWHRAQRPTGGSPPPEFQRFSVEMGLPIELAVREGWRGAFLLSEPSTGPTPAIEAVRVALMAYQSGDDSAFLGQFTVASQLRIKAGLEANRVAFESGRQNSAKEARADLQLELGELGWLVLYSRPDGEGGRVVQWQYVLRTSEGPRLANFTSYESIEVISRRSHLLDRLLAGPVSPVPASPSPKVTP